MQGRPAGGTGTSAAHEDLCRPAPTTAQELSLHQCNNLFGREGAHWALLSALRTLRRLEVSRLRFSVPRAALATLAALTRLERLSICCAKQVWE